MKLKEKKRSNVDNGAVGDGYYNNWGSWHWRQSRAREGGRKRELAAGPKRQGCNLHWLSGLESLKPGARRPPALTSDWEQESRSLERTGVDGHRQKERRRRCRYRTLLARTPHAFPFQRVPARPEVISSTLLVHNLPHSTSWAQHQTPGSPTPVACAPATMVDPHGLILF